MDILRRQSAATVAVVLIMFALVLLLQPRETVIPPAPAPWLEGMGTARIKATGVLVGISHFTTDGRVVCYLPVPSYEVRHIFTTYTISQLERWTTKPKSKREKQDNKP